LSHRTPETETAVVRDRLSVGLVPEMMQWKRAVGRNVGFKFKE
jgi:hypothetical protein